MSQGSLFAGAAADKAPLRVCGNCGATVVWTRNNLGAMVMYELRAGAAWIVARIDRDPTGGLRVPAMRWLRTNAERDVNSQPTYRKHPC